MQETAPLSKPHRWAITAIFFLSGALSLVYQVLWMRRLGLLFGNTAQASATTLTAFFLGLALGGWAAGKIAPRSRHPLRSYGWAEIGIAVGAGLFFALMRIYGAIYPALFRAMGHQATVFLLIKFLLGVLVLLPASFLIGATLPLVGQHLLRSRDELGREGALIYAVNTFGAALGAYVAAFVLPLALGFRATYLAAVLGNVALGVVVLILARGEGAAAAEPPPRIALVPEDAQSSLGWGRVKTLAFLSGLVTLALEVLWTHMFAQVLHNSVYTFAIILISFLVALALGSLLARELIRRALPPVRLLTFLWGVGGVLVALSPWLFYVATRGLSYIGRGAGWGAYQLTVFGLAALVIVPPTLLLGTVFPYLLKLSEVHSKGAGRTLGTLVAINTAAAIVGSLLAGFLLIGWIGLWSAIRFVGVLALGGVALADAKRTSVPNLPVLAGAAMGLLAVTLTGAWQPPKLLIEPGQTVKQVWEGSTGVVAVLETADDRIIVVNNHYTLGSARSGENERRQGMLPLLLHPNPREVFFLGMGTAITASAAVTPAVQRITVCELVPQVIEAARTHFAPYTSGLFTDPRTRIIAEDGRTFLGVTDERFDVIVSDLFVPWEARAGSLYSLEHFRAVREHLRPGGIFAQQIPLYQMSRREVAIVARTMLEVFPQVTAWRGDWMTRTPTLALIAQMDTIPLDTGLVARRIAMTADPALLVPNKSPRGASALLWAYCGNIAAARDLFAGAPINTDDHPLIEYLAPVTHRLTQAKRSHFLNRRDLIQFLAVLRDAMPPEQDPYLAHVSARQRLYVQAGFFHHAAMILRDEEADDEAERMETSLADVLRRASSSQP